ncbi:MAG: TetR/AcrR family transcriptional regulator [Gammaproteobacteria bacterium]
MSEHAVFAKFTNEETPDKIESTKERIITAATEVFVGYGCYRRTSTAEVSKACNVAKPTLFYHFASKQELALAVIHRVHRHCRDMIFNVLDDHNLSPQEKMEIFADNFRKFYIDNIGSKAIIFLGVELSSVAGLFKTPINNYFEEWYSVINRVLSLFCEEKDATVVAKRSLDRIVGALLLSRIHDNKIYAERMCSDIVEQWLELSTQNGDGS